MSKNGQKTSKEGLQFAFFRYCSNRDKSTSRVTHRATPDIARKVESARNKLNLPKIPDVQVATFALELGLNCMLHRPELVDQLTPGPREAQKEAA